MEGGRERDIYIFYLFIYFLKYFFDNGVGRDKTGGQILEFGVPK